MLSHNLLDVISGMGRGELEDMAHASQNATQWGETHQPSHAKVIREAMLEPGETAADMIMRGALEDEQVGPAVRVLTRETWLDKKASGELAKGFEQIGAYPLGSVTVLLTGIVQAAARGGARQQALAGFTGGLMAMGASGGGFINRKWKGLTGKNDRDGGMIQ